MRITAQASPVAVTRSRRALLRRSRTVSGLPRSSIGMTPHLAFPVRFDLRTLREGCTHQTGRSHLAEYTLPMISEDMGARCRTARLRNSLRAMHATRHNGSRTGMGSALRAVMELSFPTRIEQ